MHMKTISNKKTSRWVKVIGLSFIIFHLSIGHALAQQAGDIITGTVSDRDILSSISDSQFTALLLPTAFSFTTTALLKVLMPPLFEMDFVFI